MSLAIGIVIGALVSNLTWWYLRKRDEETGR